MISEVYNMDCMIGMKRYPDGWFDWGCVDPPYGLGNRLSDGGGKLKNTPMAVLYRGKDWDVLPSDIFWNEFFRITKNQIVFGANYFLEFLHNTRGFVCWDKKQSMPTLSACEFVWTSLDKPAKIMRYSSADLDRFHPTQKPIKVYDFMYNYCNIEKGMRLIDPFLGSGSSRISAAKLNIDFTAYEIDTDYFNDQEKRYANFKSQKRIEFPEAKIIQPEQTLF